MLNSFDHEIEYLIYRRSKSVYSAKLLKVFREQVNQVGDVFHSGHFSNAASADEDCQLDDVTSFRRNEGNLKRTSA